MRLEQDQKTHPRLLRKPVLGEISTVPVIKIEKKTSKPKRSRFVGPTQLNDEQKSRISATLKRNNIGDEMGRQIFIGAVEYQISAFAQRLVPRVAPEPDALDPGGSLQTPLRTIVEKANILSRQLRELPDNLKGTVTETLAGQDRFGRRYDERYLQELAGEIERLEHACVAVAEEPGSRKSQQDPGPDPAVGRELVAKLAEIFSECLEMEPTGERDGGFCATLEVLSEVTGLGIGQQPALLAEVLAARVS